jgi:glycosyltransferase involved in cell wall biosynthesis
VKQKRILIVANTTWNIYKFRLNVIQQFLENGSQVLVASPIDEFIYYKEEFPSVVHIDLKKLKRDHTHPINDLLSIFELKKVYKSVNPDVIIHYTHKANIYGGIASWMAGKRSVAVVTGLGYAFLHKGLVNMATKLLYKLTKGIHKKIIFENEDDMNFFIDAKLIQKGKAEFVNGCGIDVDDYKPVPKNSDYPKFIFTFIGRLLKDKGINEFLQASAILMKTRSDIEFRVIGEFDEGNPSMVEKKLLLDYIDKGFVLYLGFVNDIKPQIAQSDCIVLPSYREGMPRVILEALAMAKPVVTTNVAGCRQTVEHGINGYLVKDKDVQSLVHGLQQISALNEKQLFIMGQKGREMAIKQFNSKKISKELYEIVSQVYFCA